MSSAVKKLIAWIQVKLWLQSLRLKRIFLSAENWKGGGCYSQNRPIQNETSMTRTHICVFKDICLCAFRHEDVIKLEFFQTSGTLNLNGVLIWCFDDWEITLPIEKKTQICVNNKHYTKGLDNFCRSCFFLAMTKIPTHCEWRCMYICGFFEKDLETLSKNIWFLTSRRHCLAANFDCSAAWCFVKIELVAASLSSTSQIALPWFFLSRWGVWIDSRHGSSLSYPPPCCNISSAKPKRI